MKDRQPTQVLSNGAIRYGFYNADGTLNHYEYLKRDDAPTEEGTPLNKANLLSDATAAKIWPGAATRPEDPTVNDALFKLAKEHPRSVTLPSPPAQTCPARGSRATGAPCRRSSTRLSALCFGHRTARQSGRKRLYQQTSERAAMHFPTKTDTGSAHTGTQHPRTFWYQTMERHGQNGQCRRISG